MLLSMSTGLSHSDLQHQQGVSFSIFSCFSSFTQSFLFSLILYSIWHSFSLFSISSYPSLQLLILRLVLLLYSFTPLFFLLLFSLLLSSHILHLFPLLFSFSIIHTTSLPFPFLRSSDSHNCAPKWLATCHACPLITGFIGQLYSAWLHLTYHCHTKASVLSHVAL
jgi:hypothetical protein